jgi:hypothetical protein
VTGKNSTEGSKETEEKERPENTMIEPLDLSPNYLYLYLVQFSYLSD